MTTETQKVLPETTWEQELAKPKSQSENFDQTGAMKLESGKTTKFTLDLSRTIKEWTADDGTIKKIIPVTFKGEPKVLFVNVKNPLYSQLLERVKAGKLEVSVSTTGSAKQTRYSIMEEA